MTFEETIAKSFAFTVPSIEAGHPLREGVVAGQPVIRIPLAMMNRHGLIAGSTGTGKTRTLQLLVEGLSRAGVPTFVSDVKGDLSGLAQPGSVNAKIEERLAPTGRTFKPEAFPVELMSLTGARGFQLRATVSSFGPLLLGKVLDLTQVQQSVLALVFQYCDDKKLPLLDLHDLREVLRYLSADGKEEARQYGGMSSATVGVLLRNMVELEQQGAGQFFGEPELDVMDLIRLDPGGRGVVNILTLADVQDRPRLFSTFLMWLLGQFYYRLPEVGDIEKPKLVFFFDEAHLLFDDASSALVEHIEQVARLIRSKGVGVFFVTQTPKDVDEDVLAQLGNRVQHAFRVFTASDAKNLKSIVSTFPMTEFYKLETTLTSLGIGEAVVTVLDPKGSPTPVVAARILPPSSVMGPADEATIQALSARSVLRPKYSTAVDRESAKEILTRKLEEARQASADEEPPPRAASRSRAKEPKGIFDSPIAKTAARQAARTVTSSVIRGIFGLLKGRR